MAQRLSNNSSIIKSIGRVLYVIGKVIFIIIEATLKFSARVLTYLVCGALYGAPFFLILLACGVDKTISASIGGVVGSVCIFFVAELMFDEEEQKKNNQ